MLGIGHAQLLILVLVVVGIMGCLKLMSALLTLTSLIALNEEHTSAYVALAATAVIAQQRFGVAGVDMNGEKRNSGSTAPKVALG